MMTTNTDAAKAEPMQRLPSFLRSQAREYRERAMPERANWCECWADEVDRAQRAAPVAPPPVEASNIGKEYSRFLSDVMTAAGLVTHGRKCKALGERLADGAMQFRSVTFQDRHLVKICRQAIASYDAYLQAGIADADWAPVLHQIMADMRERAGQPAPDAPPPVGDGVPIPMVLHCPACALQHVDAPSPTEGKCLKMWSNPPHRSHLCRPEDGGCGHIWRPADVPTTGVAAVSTKGKADSPTLAPVALAAGRSGKDPAAREPQPVLSPTGEPQGKPGVVLHRMKYHVHAADPELGTEEDWELFPADVDCPDCIDVLIVRAALTGAAPQAQPEVLPHDGNCAECGKHHDQNFALYCADCVMKVAELVGTAATPAPAQVAPTDEAAARALYTQRTDNDPVVHSNRFPGWGELSAAEKAVWLEKARPLTQGGGQHGE